MKFNITKILAAGALALAAVSCDDVLVDNVNPDAAHANTAERGLPVVVFYASQINYDHAEYYVYLSQCLTTMNKATLQRRMGIPEHQPSPPVAPPLLRHRRERERAHQEQPGTGFAQL